VPRYGASYQGGTKKQCAKDCAIRQNCLSSFFYGYANETLCALFAAPPPEDANRATIRCDAAESPYLKFIFGTAWPFLTPPFYPGGLDSLKPVTTWLFPKRWTGSVPKGDW
jgi:hypothetical protein